MLLTTLLRRFQTSRGLKRVSPGRRTQFADFHVEQLEPRIVPYSTSGNLWPHPELVTISFAPDGTNNGGYASDLFAEFNSRFGSAATWQNQILKAAQVWAQQTNINFSVISDNGADSGSGDYQQGDSGFGDIRFFGLDLGTPYAEAMAPPPINNFSIAGDITFNTTTTFSIGSGVDLFTVAAHEIGHSLGLSHSTTAAAVMYSVYNGVKTVLNTDDINGIRNVYSSNAARSKDSYDTAAANGTFATASVITSQIDTTLKTAVVNNLDVTTTADLDYYKFTAPSGGTGTMVVHVQSSGLSLLAPKAWVYNSAQSQLATVTGTGYQGSTLTMTVSGIVAGQTYYVKVDGADNTAFGTGKYALTLNFGTNADPTVTLPNTQTPNGDPPSSGGGEAVGRGHHRQHRGADDIGIQSSTDQFGADVSSDNDDDSTHAKTSAPVAVDWESLLSVLHGLLD